MVFNRQMNSSSARVKELEEQIQELESRHNRYRDSVSEHFGMTAELIQQMTESYRDVYQHLATGAQNLCSSEVASKLLPAGQEPTLDPAAATLEKSEPEKTAFDPPKDYVPKHEPGQKGALAEDFGLEKPQSGNDEEA